MTNTPLPAELRDFLQKHIASVEEMEILLLFQKHATETWTADRVFSVIQSNLLSIHYWMDELCSQGFLSADFSSDPPGYRYAPSDSVLADRTAALAEAYRERPVRVIEAIFSQSNRQLRHFADAFRLRRKDP